MKNYIFCLFVCLLLSFFIYFFLSQCDYFFHNFFQTPTIQNVVLSFNYYLSLCYFIFKSYKFIILSITVFSLVIISNLSLIFVPFSFFYSPCSKPFSILPFSIIALCLLSILFVLFLVASYFYGFKSMFFVGFFYLFIYLFHSSYP